MTQQQHFVRKDLTECLHSLYKDQVERGTFHNQEKT
jgi:hypothetical protein